MPKQPPRRSHVRRAGAVAVALLCSAGLSAIAANTKEGGGELAEDFKLYKRIIKEYYHARYEGKPDDAVLADIAKRLEAKQDAVTAVFKRGKELARAYGEKLSSDASQYVQGKSVQTVVGPVSLEGRLKPVIIDARTAHVIAYVKWEAGERLTLEEEASLAALAVAQASDDIDTIALGAVKGSPDNAVFTAKIARDAASRISVSRIAMFADKRYIRLFEDVTFK